MRKFAISIAISLVASTSVQAQQVTMESIVVDDGGSSTTVVEERMTYQRRVTQTGESPSGIVIIPGDSADSGEESDNPFEDPEHFEITDDPVAGVLLYRTKNLTLKVAEDGVVINGDFHKWRHKNYSWGVFDRAREIEVKVESDEDVKITVDVNWKRTIWGSAGKDTIELSKTEFKTTEEVTDSILDLGNDFDQGILKLDSSQKINKLVSLINPFLAEPYNKALVQSENLSQREQLIERMISQAQELYGADAENEFLKRKFIQHYKVGFTADELIKIAQAAYGADAENEILKMGAQAYLYFYSEDDIKKVGKAAYGADAENEILMLLTERGAGSQAGVIREIPGTSEEDMERSRFVSDLIATAKDATTNASRNRILMNGFMDNLDLNFSLTDIMRIARLTTTNAARNELLEYAARHYGRKWSQDDFRVLARAATTNAARNRILELSAEYLTDRAGSGFYDSDFKDDYRSSDGDYKDGHNGGDLKEGSDTRVDVRINSGSGSNVRVDVDVD